MHLARTTERRTLLHFVPPLFIYTLLFMSGIIWQAHTLRISYLLVSLAITLICYKYLKHLPLHHKLPWLAAAFLAGGLRNAMHEYYLVRLAQQLCNKKITITGSVVNKEPTNKHYVTCFTVAVDEYSHYGVTHAVDQPMVKLYYSGRAALEYGDTITVQDLFLKTPEKESYLFFFKKQGIVASGFAGKSQKIIVQKQLQGLQGWVFAKRNQVLCRFSALLSPRTAMLVNSIFLGYKAQKNKTSEMIYEQFQWWGISHYLARSGLHLVMLVIILHFLFMFLPLPLLCKQFATAACIIAYMLFSWSSVSFMRSLLMIFCYLLCATLKIQQHPLHTISLACMAILLYNPSFLFALDFELSFGLTLALILLHQVQVIQKNLNTCAPQPQSTDPEAHS